MTATASGSPRATGCIPKLVENRKPAPSGACTGRDLDRSRHRMENDHDRKHCSPVDADRAGMAATRAPVGIPPEDS